MRLWGMETTIHSLLSSIFERSNKAVSPQSFWVQHLCPVSVVDGVRAPRPHTISCLRPALKGWQQKSGEGSNQTDSCCDSCLRFASVWIIVVLQQTFCLRNLDVHHVGKTCRYWRNRGRKGGVITGFDKFKEAYVAKPPWPSLSFMNLLIPMSPRWCEITFDWNEGCI